jgi:beta-galactosidase
MMEAKMIIEADKNQLHHDLTYDMTRVVVKMVDQFGNILDYANEVVTVETADGVEVVGPKSSALNGGSTAFYIRSIAPVGKTNVTFSFNHYPSQELEFNVK